MSSAATTKRILFLNRSYYPDAEATGQLLTQLCEDLTSEFRVSVIAGQPNQNPQQMAFRRHGLVQHNGVSIRRVWHTRFSKASFIGRAANLLSYLVMASVVALTTERPDVVVVESDPPLLCLLGAWLKRRYRCKSVVYLQDIYPHLAIAIGKLPDNWWTQLLERRFSAAYRFADRVVVLSEDMRNVVLDADVPPDSVDVIPNWFDASQIKPHKTNNAFRAELGLDDKFIVMYSGNLGLCQGLDNILAAAEQLQLRKDMVFLIIGDGAAKRQLMDAARERSLSNVQFIDYQPLARLGVSLSAADLHLVPVDRRVSRYLMPSKLYGALASGTPVVTVAPESSELAQLVRDERVGMNVEPDQPEELAETLVWFAEWCGDLEDYGKRARNLAMKSFDRPVSVDRFRRMLRQVIDPTPELQTGPSTPSAATSPPLRDQPT